MNVLFKNLIKKSIIVNIGEIVFLYNYTIYILKRNFFKQ
jgi:hypothetical protein